MFLQEGTVTTQRADVFLRTDTQVVILADKEFQLVGKVGKVLVVWCSRE